MTERAYTDMIAEDERMEQARMEFVLLSQTAETTKPGVWVDAQDREPSEDGRYLVKGEAVINGEHREFCEEMEYTFYFDEIMNDVEGEWNEYDMEKKGYRYVDVFKWTTIG